MPNQVTTTTKTASSVDIYLHEMQKQSASLAFSYKNAGKTLKGEIINRIVQITKKSYPTVTRWLRSDEHIFPYSDARVICSELFIDFEIAFPELSENETI